MDKLNVLNAMNLNGVRLTDGMFAAQQSAARDYYVGINDDDLLWGFRTRAGKPAPGSRLMGWYGSGIYHVFGQILSGLVRLSKSMSDDVVCIGVRHYNQVDRAVPEWQLLAHCR